MPDNSYIGLGEPFGDGSLGDLTVTGLVALTGTSMYRNVTVASAGNLSAAGYPLLCNGTLKIISGGIINCDGRAGGNAAQGTANTAAGGTAPYTSRTCLWFPVPGAGGNGGKCTAASAFANMAGSATVSQVPSGFAPFTFLVGGGGGGGGYFGATALATAAAAGGPPWCGASGGNGGAASGTAASACNGGGGGAGGGVCVIYARTIDNAGTIRAKGGAGGKGTSGAGASAGNGGGGGGGAVIVFYRNAGLNGVGTLLASAGVKGATASGGYGGADGVAGLTGSFVI